MLVSLSPKKEKMEKIQKEKGNLTDENSKIQEKKEIQTHEKPKSHVWDCDSSLYDSFELKSFERQLDSAIAMSRTLSMPHLSNPPAHAPPQPVSKKSSSRFSRSFQKLLRSIFRHKQTSSSLFKLPEGTEDGFYVLHDRSGAGRALSTIPEVPVTGTDHGGFSPDFEPLMTRSASDRFSTPTSIGISCSW